MAEWVKDLVWSLQWHGSLLWFRFDPWPQELPHAACMVKKKKKRKEKKKAAIIFPPLGI